MEKNTPDRKGRQRPTNEQCPAPKKELMDEEKPINSGISQPHNTKKEALGPNTDR